MLLTENVAAKLDIRTRYFFLSFFLAIDTAFGHV